MFLLRRELPKRDGFRTLLKAELRRLELQGGRDDGHLAGLLRAALNPSAQATTAATRIELARPTLEADKTPMTTHNVATVGEMARRSSVRPPKALLLSAAVEVWQPSCVLEMGTCCGVSTAFIASALPANASLLSLELSPVLAAAAEQFLLSLDLGAEIRVGDFADTFEPALTHLPDVAFVDGNHKEVPTLHYFDRLATVCKPGALLIFDDISWSDGMKTAWSQIRADSRVASYADLGVVGLVVTGH